MVKPITFEYRGTKYTLEYTRKTIKRMEENGFRINQVAEQPMSMLPALFAGAFLAHHRYTPQDTIDDIFEHMGDKENLYVALGELYRATMEALTAEPTEGNIKWEMSL